MVEDIKQFCKDFSNKLFEQTTFQEVSGYTKITMPHLDPYNDFLEIYVQRGDVGHFIISDDGYVFQYVFTLISDIEIQKLIITILTCFEIQRQDDVLIIHARDEDVGQMINRMITAIMAINALGFCTIALGYKIPESHPTCLPQGGF